MWDILAALIANGRGRREAEAAQPQDNGFGFSAIQQPLIGAPDAPESASMPTDVLKEMGLDGVARMYAARPWEIGQRLKDEAGKRVMGFFGGGK